MSERRCMHCGEPFKERGQSRVCPSCRAAMGRYDEEYKKRAKEQKPKKKVIKRPAVRNRIDKSRCKTCLYRMHLGECTEWMCGYCYYTGKRRPCEISKDCIVYEKFDKRKRRALAMNLKNIAAGGAGNA